MRDNQLTDWHISEISKRITNDTILSDLGMALWMSFHAVETCRMKTPDDIIHAAQNMIQRWCRNTEDRTTAWLKLKEALKEAQLTRCIKEILEVQRQI